MVEQEPPKENEFKDLKKPKKGTSSKPIIIFAFSIFSGTLLLLLKPLWFLIALMLLVVWYVLQPRVFHNFFHSVFRRKSYVVCHMKNPATDFIDDWLVVPDKEKLTKVGGGYYDLADRYSILKFNGRLHFLLQKNNAIPIHLGKDNNDEILIQVAEITAALEAKPYRYLLNPKTDWKFYIAIVGLAISIIIGLYALNMINQMKPILEWMYTHPIGVSADGNSYIPVSPGK